MNYANTRYVGLGHFDHIIWMITLSMITKSSIHCSWILIFLVPEYSNRVKKKVFSKIQLTWSDRVITMYGLNEWMKLTSSSMSFQRYTIRKSIRPTVLQTLRLKWMKKQMNECNWPRHQCRLPPQRYTFRKSIPPMFGDEGWQLSEGWRPLSLPENKINWTVSIKNKIFSLFSKLTFISLLESLVFYTNRELSSSTPGPNPSCIRSLKTSLFWSL